MADVSDYLENSDDEGEAMRALRAKTASTNWSHEWLAKRTMFAYGPEVCTDPLEAQLLFALSTMKQPRRTLETDMFTGYGAAATQKGFENATLVSLEIDSFLKPCSRMLGIDAKALVTPRDRGRDCS